MKPRISPFMLVAFLLAGQYMAVWSATARSDTLDERFLQGLRERQLFALAEDYCSSRLQDAQLSDAKRAALAIEFSRTLAEHAVQLPAPQRAPYWKRAREVGESFVRSSPNDPRVLLVRMQIALVALVHGELDLNEADVGDSPSLAAARDALETAVGELKQLDEAISNPLDEQNHPAASDNAQPAGTGLAELQNHVRYQLARALRNEALCDPDGSPERINALTQAVEQLGPLGQLSPENSLTQSSLLDAATCNRLLRDYPAAERTLGEIPAKDTTTEIAQRVRAERIHLALDRGQIDHATSLTGRPGSVDGGSNAELDDARLQAYLAARTRSQEHNDRVQTAEWDEDVTAQARFISKTHAPYWARRADTLVARAIRGSSNSAIRDSLEQAAVNYYRAGQFGDAVEAYDRAAAEARDRNRPDEAFRLRLAAATIEAEQHHAAEAATRYRELAFAAPDHPKAADAHLLAIYNTGQALQEQQTPALAEYEQMLREHVARWPKSATAGQAWCWLGRLREHERAWREAINAYSSVPAGHAQYAAAIEAAGRCYDESFADLQARGKFDLAMARQAAGFFDQVLSARLESAGRTRDGAGQPDFSSNAAGRTVGGASQATGKGQTTGKSAADLDLSSASADELQRLYPPHWDPTVGAATLAAARIWVHQLDKFEPAERVLRAALRGTPDAPAEWATAARALLVEALAGAGHVPAAQTQVQQLADASPADLLTMLEGLARLAEHAPSAQRSNLALLELDAANLLGADKMSESEQLRLQRVRATALVDAGRGDEALADWKALARRMPNDGATQEQYALLLSATGDANAQQTAQSKWHEIRDKSPAGTARWFRANLALAEAELKRGRQREARAIVRLVQLSYPDLGGDVLRPKFQDVLARSGN